MIGVRLLDLYSLTRPLRPVREAVQKLGVDDSGVVNEDVPHGGDLLEIVPTGGTQQHGKIDVQVRAIELRRIVETLEDVAPALQRSVRGISPQAGRWKRLQRAEAILNRVLKGGGEDAALGQIAADILRQGGRGDRRGALESALQTAAWGPVDRSLDSRLQGYRPPRSRRTPGLHGPPRLLDCVLFRQPSAPWGLPGL